MGALIQAGAAIAMAGAAAFLDGMVAGVTIVVALAIFALGRSLNSMSSKDVQGRTLPKGQRGQISGLSTVASGVVAIGIGLGLRAFGEDLSPAILAVFLAAAGVLWIIAAVIYIRIEEPPPPPESASSNWWRTMVELYRADRPFRMFVTVRALLLVSALTPPFLVTLAADYGNTMISGLGGFVIASALAAILGGRTAGRLADRSSRNVMVVGAITASAIVAVVVVTDLLFSDHNIGWVYTVAFFLISLVHVAIRVGRKTYIVDMAEGDQRTTYVAVANTSMGMILLVTGAISAYIASYGEIAALIFLGSLGALGAVLGSRMKDVSRH